MGCEGGGVRGEGEVGMGCEREEKWREIERANDRERG